MFEHGFPPYWSTIKKLIWLVGTGIVGGVTEIWKTVTGALIHITDALASPVKELSVAIEPQQDLHGQNAPYPPGGSNNIIPDGTDTSNGYVNGQYPKSDGTLQTDSNWYTSEYFPVTAGETYTWSGNYNPNSPSICFYDSGKNFISAIQAAQALPKTFTVPTGAVYCRAIQGKNFANHGQQIELGSTATTPKPYSNICQISGWTGCNVWRTRKNILPLDIYTGINYNKSVGTVLTPSKTNRHWVQGDGEISYTTTSTYTPCSMMTPLLPPGDYRIHIKKTSSEIIRYSAYALDKTYTVLSKTYDSSLDERWVSFTLPDWGYIAVMVDNGSTANQTLKLRALLEAGTAFTEYAPYQGTTYPISFRSKNLFDKSQPIQGGWYNDNGELQSSTTTGHSALMECLPSTEYTLSGTLKKNTSFTTGIYFWDSGKNFISRSVTTSMSAQTVTTPQNCVYLSIQLATPSNAENVGLNIDTVQVEKGSATSYEPYQYTVYGGTLTVNEDGSADLVSKYVSITVDENYDTSDVWVNTSSNYPYIMNCPFAQLTGTAIKSNTVALVSNMKYYTYSNRQKATPYSVYQVNTKGLLSIVLASDSGVSTKAQLQSWLHDNPIQIVYEMRTPVTYHLDSIEQIYTLAGENNIWADVNGEITLTYKSDGRDSDTVGTGKADYMKLLS